MPLGRAQIGVARGKGQTVGLAHRRHALDAHGNIEIAGDAADDLELLVILLAEAGDVRPGLDQELGNDGGDAGEMAGPEGATKPLRDRPGIDRDGEAGRVHLCQGRRIEEIAPGRSKLCRIVGLAARIAREILGRPELRGIDEEAGDDSGAKLARPRDEGEMPGMKRAHGRNEGHGCPCAVPGRDLAPQRRHATNHREAADPLRLRLDHRERCSSH